MRKKYRKMNNMKKRRALLIFSAIILLFVSAACSYDGNPPDDGTPWPENHNGIFVSEYGSMTFNGDGETVIIDFSDELAQKTGLPAGEQSGNYVFLYHINI